ncbi:unnamed protein product [Lampetra planeri]
MSATPRWLQYSAGCTCRGVHDRHTRAESRGRPARAATQAALASCSPGSVRHKPHVTRGRVACQTEWTAKSVKGRCRGGRGRVPETRGSQVPLGRASLKRGAGRGPREFCGPGDSGGRGGATVAGIC